MARGLSPLSLMLWSPKPRNGDGVLAKRVLPSFSLSSLIIYSLIYCKATGSLPGIEYDYGISPKFVCTPIPPEADPSCYSPPSMPHGSASNGHSNGHNGSSRRGVMSEEAKATILHLRESLVRQKEMILDQRETIRELTAKLTLCEGFGGHHSIGHHDTNHHDNKHHDSNHHDSNHHDSNHHDSNHHNDHHGYHGPGNHYPPSTSHHGPSYHDNGHHHPHSGHRSDPHHRKGSSYSKHSSFSAEQTGKTLQTLKERLENLQARNSSSSYSSSLRDLLQRKINALEEQLHNYYRGHHDYGHHNDHHGDHHDDHRGHHDDHHDDRHDDRHGHHDDHHDDHHGSHGTGHHDDHHASSHHDDHHDDHHGNGHHDDHHGITHYNNHRYNHHGSHGNHDHHYSRHYGRGHHSNHPKTHHHDDHRGPGYHSNLRNDHHGPRHHNNHHRPGYHEDHYVPGPHEEYHRPGHHDDHYVPGPNDDHRMTGPHDDHHGPGHHDNHHGASLHDDHHDDHHDPSPHDDHHDDLHGRGNHNNHHGTGHHDVGHHGNEQLPSISKQPSHSGHGKLDTILTHLHHRNTDPGNHKKPKTPEAFQISFPMRTNYMHAKMKRSLVKELFALTICLWMKGGSGPGLGTPFSYSVPGQANELVLMEWGTNPMELLINDKAVTVPISMTDGKWHHVCVTWSTRDGLWEAYQDGVKKGSGDNLSAWHSIKPGGTFIMGQEQDTVGGRFDATQSYVGDMSDLQFWSRVLTPNEIYGQASCGSHQAGDVMSWTESAVELGGGVSAHPFDPCQ